MSRELQDMFFWSAFYRYAEMTFAHKLPGVWIYPYPPKVGVGR